MSANQEVIEWALTYIPSPNRSEVRSRLKTLADRLDHIAVLGATIQCGQHAVRNDPWCSTCRGLRVIHAASTNGPSESWSLEHENRRLKREAQDIGAFIDAVIADRDYYERLSTAGKETP